MKILVATDKPFAPVAVTMIREVVEKAGHTLALLEKYKTPQELHAAVADADANTTHTGVQLFVPATSQAKVGSYSADLTWTITAAPL